jgi:hypothetical protein
MSFWIERIENHGVFQAMHDLEATLSVAQTTAEQVSDALPALERLRSIVVASLARLDAVDPNFVMEGPLTAIMNSANTVKQRLSAFSANSDVQQLNQANAEIDGILQQLPMLSTVATVADAKVIRQIVTGLRKDAEDTSHNLRTRAGELAASLAEVDTKRESLAKELAKVQSDLANIQSQFQSQFADAQERRQNEFFQAQQGRATETTAAVADMQSKFATTMGQLEDGTKVQLSDLSKVLTTKLDELDAQMREKIAAQDIAAKTFLDGLNQSSQEANRLVGLIGNRGVISNYQRVADRARKASWQWQGIAMVTMIAYALVAYIRFLPQLDAPFRWGGLVGRLLVTLAVAAVAAYAAVEASKNQRIEMDNRKVELDLAALGPFLAGLDVTRLEEFKLKVADRVFGRPVDTTFIQPGPTSALGVVTDHIDIEKLIVDLFDRSVRAAKPL